MTQTSWPTTQSATRRVVLLLKRWHMFPHAPHLQFLLTFMSLMFPEMFLRSNIDNDVLDTTNANLLTNLSMIRIFTCNMYINLSCSARLESSLSPCNVHISCSNARCNDCARLVLLSLNEILPCGL
jgi:hypothetical protein